MEKEEIKRTVLNLICKIRGGEYAEQMQEWCQSPLTGELWGLGNIGLTYLFFELEEVFRIRFTNDFLDDYGFISIERIVEYLYRHTDIQIAT